MTNTLPIPTERRFDSLTVLSIAPLIARAIREVFEDGSVTSLFNGSELQTAARAPCLAARSSTGGTGCPSGDRRPLAGGRWMVG